VAERSRIIVSPRIDGIPVMDELLVVTTGGTIDKV
jgi:hypothetical protein